LKKKTKINKKKRYAYLSQHIKEVKLKNPKVGTEGSNRTRNLWKEQSSWLAPNQLKEWKTTTLLTDKESCMLHFHINLRTCSKYQFSVYNKLVVTFNLSPSSTSSIQKFILYELPYSFIIWSNPLDVSAVPHGLALPSLVDLLSFSLNISIR